MNKVLNLNVNQAKSFINEEVYEIVKKEMVEAHKLLRAQTGPGNDFLGWLNLPVDIDLEEVDRIKKAAENGELFALQVSGESMRDLGMFDGDIVIVRKDCPVRNGDVVVALINNETTVKSYYLQADGKIELHPANSEFKVQTYDAGEVAVQGKVIALNREF